MTNPEHQMRMDLDPVGINPTDSASGVSVNLGERALHLSGALDEYLSLSKLKGFGYALDSPHSKVLRQRYDDNAISRIDKGQQSHENKGDVKFRLAFGSQALIDAGVDPSDVEFEEREGKEGSGRFKHLYVGPDNERYRTKFRKVLKSQIK